MICEIRTGLWALLVVGMIAVIIFGFIGFMWKRKIEFVFLAQLLAMCIVIALAKLIVSFFGW